MPTTVHFAHLTDIHISERGQPYSTVGALAVELLTESIGLLNQMPDLDFVLITGDVLDTASHAEAARFQDLIAGLERPWYFIPGNHDGFIDPHFPDALRPEEAVTLIDPRLAEPAPYAGHSWWSRTIRPGVQLIGLDSRLADDWNGLVSAAQLAWLDGELGAHRDDLVILAVHHPLHALGAHNSRGRFGKFICDNGAEVEALLDHYPAVKVVLSGHHHANHLSFSNGGRRLHLCTSALSGYPCIFRTVQMTQVAGGWNTVVMAHSTANAHELERAYKTVMADHMSSEYNPDTPSAYVDFLAGRAEDLAFEGVLA